MTQGRCGRPFGLVDSSALSSSSGRTLALPQGDVVCPCVYQARLDKVSQLMLNGRLWLCTNDGFLCFTVNDNLHHGNRSHLVGLSQGFFFVDVDLDDLDFVGVLSVNLLKDGTECFTGTAPRSREVKYDRLLVVDYVSLKVRLSRVLHG